MANVDKPLLLQHHKLTGESFQKALERYCDESKPDQLVLKQIQGWEMQWDDEEEDEQKEDNTPIGSSSSENDDDNDDGLSFQPTDVLKGILTWKNEYMIASIKCECYWEKPIQQSQQQSGSLYFVVKTKLRIRNKHDNISSTQQHDENEEKKSKQEKRAEEKIRSRMIQRLKEDSYIKRLLLGTTPGENSNHSNKKKKDKNKKTNDEDDDVAMTRILCKARIYVKNSSSSDSSTPQQQQQSLEERVDVTDDVAEGLRRGLFSQSESSLDVVELLLSLPLLPGSAHYETTQITCPLADRAKLRLLEDAMFDACEREGEDEILDDLKISSSTTTGGGDNGGGDNNNNSGGGRPPTTKQQRPKHSKQQHHHQQNNQSNKRTKR